ncbi:ribonuclease H-like domain-containing protein [Tanacetum coccineum]
MHPLVTRVKADIFKPLEHMNCHVTTTSPLPRSHVHALQDPNWKEAMYKARLVANGRNQQQGIDCDETFSPVVKPATIRIVLSLVVSRDWPIHQLDVKNVFFHGHLSETVYMHQPPGFVDPAHPDYVCHLKRSLYGLKQASRAWFQRFASYATRVGFQHNKTDSSLFIFHRGADIAYLLLYVDDIILTTSSAAYLQQAISSLNSEFFMTDLGSLTYFIGIEFDRHVTLSHSSVEAEYRGVANVVSETAWIRNLLRELRAPFHTTTIVYYGNVSAVYLFANPIQNQHTKHIEIDIHFVQNYVASGQVRVLHVLSRFQYADIFTKGLLSALFLEFCSSLNSQRPPVPTKGEY